MSGTCISLHTQQRWFRKRVICYLLVVGCWLLVGGCWLVVSSWLLVGGCCTDVPWHVCTVVGSWLLVVSGESSPPKRRFPSRRHVDA